jgi:hypothetical protein
VIATGFGPEKIHRLELEDLHIPAFGESGDLDLPAFLKKKI